MAMDLDALKALNHGDSQDWVESSCLLAQPRTARVLLCSLDVQETVCSKAAPSEPWNLQYMHHAT